MKELTLDNIRSYEIKRNNPFDYESDFLRFLNTTSKQTFKTYKNAIKNFYEYCCSVDALNPTQETLLSYKLELNRKYEPTTSRLYIVALKQFFKYLAFNGIYKNITEYVKSPKVASNVFRKEALTESQAIDLINYYNSSDIDSKRNKAIISLMLTSGMRVNELSNALMSDISNINNQTCLYVLGKGKTEKLDYIKIDTRVEKLIRDYVSMKPSIKEDTPIFTNDRYNLNTKLTTRTIENIINKALKGIGIKSNKITSHSLRHTYATLLFNQGKDILVVKDALRHSDIKTTQIYINSINRAKLHNESDIANILIK